jgi:hypothetical protein
LRQNEKILNCHYPFKDESLYGYLLRISYENRYQGLWILQHANVTHKRFSKYDILALSEEDLNKLSMFLSVSSEILSKLNFNLANSLKLEPFQVLPKMFIATEKIKICPLCFQNRAHLKRVWDIYTYNVCHIHCVLLMDKCPQCSKPIKFHDKKGFLCRYCDYDYLLHNFLGQTKLQKKYAYAGCFSLLIFANT